VIGASTGVFGAVWAQAEARKVLAATGARVIDVELPVGGAEAAFDGDRLADRELHARLAEVIEELVVAANERRELATIRALAA
jgi:chromate reductase